MTGAFATVEDLEARWRRMSETEMTRAAALLEDATDLIKTIAPKWETIEVSILKRVACQVVKRAMLASDLGEVSSLQEQTGPFMTQVSYSNPQGDLYLTRLEKIQLGLLKNKAFEVDLLAGRSE